MLLLEEWPKKEEPTGDDLLLLLLLLFQSQHQHQQEDHDQEHSYQQSSIRVADGGIDIAPMLLQLQSETEVRPSRAV
ncbi:hypothetical protein TYRP_002406 [Tyrophagus putrescentiae]|nr:hypothetical protein TYRP_002406 [Tyrophagus putrescentiae]